MNASADHETREREWLEYYTRFDYFTPDAIRDGCHPRIILHDSPSGKAIVLVHGLSDSPYFLTAVAEHFHNRLGYDCYLPLLHQHGLKQPQGMEGVQIEEWKTNVRFAVRVAAARSEKVSIGGLSTGGTLSFHAACTMPRITGDLYLFSAALDLAGGPLGLIGEIKERLARTFVADLLDKKDPLIGKNPYRYKRIDMDGAHELSRLIHETDDLLEDFDPDHPFPKRVFAAHSRCDQTAHIDGIWALKKKCPPDRFTALVLSKDVVNCRENGVPHASVVLKEPIFAPGTGEDRELLEPHNPEFDSLTTAITEFADV